MGGVCQSSDDKHMGNNTIFAVIIKNVTSLRAEQPSRPEDNAGRSSVNTRELAHPPSIRERWLLVAQWRGWVDLLYRPQLYMPQLYTAITTYGHNCIGHNYIGHVAAVEGMGRFVVRWIRAGRKMKCNRQQKSRHVSGMGHGAWGMGHGAWGVGLWLVCLYATSVRIGHVLIITM